MNNMEAGVSVIQPCHGQLVDLIFVPISLSSGELLQLQMSSRNQGQGFNISHRMIFQNHFWLDAPVHSIKPDLTKINVKSIFNWLSTDLTW